MTLPGLAALGLERRKPPVPSLEQYVQSRYPAKTETEGGGGAGT